VHVREPGIPVALEYFFDIEIDRWDITAADKRLEEGPPLLLLNLFNREQVDVSTHQIMRKPELIGFTEEKRLLRVDTATREYRLLQD
jgi:hypothetical protein